jgi:transposase-like protein
MFGRETRMLLRHYLEQGTSKSALARKLGVHRDTVHRWIRDGELDRDLDGEPVRYGPRRPVATKLDAYKSIVEARRRRSVGFSAGGTVGFRTGVDTSGNRYLLEPLPCLAGVIG